MYAALLAVALLVNQGEPLACQSDYTIAPRLERHLEQTKGKIEVRSKDQLGYIYTLFIGRLLLTGVFYTGETGIIACDITSAIEVDEGGKMIFFWQESERES